MGAVGMTHERPGRMARGNIRDVAYLLQCKYPTYAHIVHGK